MCVKEQLSNWKYYYRTKSCLCLKCSNINREIACWCVEVADWIFTSVVHTASKTTVLTRKIVGSHRWMPTTPTLRSTTSASCFILYLTVVMCFWSIWRWDRWVSLKHLFVCMCISAPCLCYLLAFCWIFTLLYMLMSMTRRRLIFRDVVTMLGIRETRMKTKTFADISPILTGCINVTHTQTDRQNYCSIYRSCIQWLDQLAFFSNWL